MRYTDMVLAGIDAMDVGGVDPFGVGAAMPALRRASSFQPNTAQVLNVARSQMLQQAALSESMPCVLLPVDSVALVGAGAALAVVVTPVSNIRITRFTVSPAAAGAFSIASILAGRVNLFAGAGAVPADLFAPNFAGPPIEVPLVQAGTQISVNGTNNSGAGVRFIGAFSTIDLTLRLRGQ